MPRPLDRNGLPGGPVSPEETARANHRFREQQERFDFRYRCDDCMHLDRERSACSLGFQKELFGDGPHRCRDQETGSLVFCKYFELE